MDKNNCEYDDRIFFLGGGGRVESLKERGILIEIIILYDLYLGNYFMWELWFVFILKKLIF